MFGRIAAAVLIALLLLVGNPRAQEDARADSQSVALSDYLHRHKLPLVNARILDNDSIRTVILYGFTATRLGKVHAAQRTADYLKDPAIRIDNRIKIRPELAHSPARSSGQAMTLEPKEGLAQDNAPNDGAADAPPDVGDLNAYANQQLDDENKFISRGTPGVMVMPLGMLGFSGGFGALASPYRPVYPIVPPYFPSSYPRTYVAPGFPANPYAPFNPYSPYRPYVPTAPRMAPMPRPFVAPFHIGR